MLPVETVTPHWPSGRTQLAHSCYPKHWPGVEPVTFCDYNLCLIWWLFQGERSVPLAGTKSADDRHPSAAHPRRYRHSADKERCRGRHTSHQDSTTPPSASAVPSNTSPSPTRASKHRRLDDSKDRGRRGSYALQYRKYQQVRVNCVAN